MLYLGDCKEILPGLPANSVDSIVTDPPYGWLFMGKKWDYEIPSVGLWKEVFRVLKPGGYAVVACGTRTQHRMAVNLEDAGFEIRDVIAWLYGCLSDDTEILTIDGWEHYHKNIDKNPVLCYNIANDEFSFNKPLRSFHYENKHTAYRIQSDNTDQIVSRNHRVIVEQSGRKVFKYAEELETKESVPFLESLQDLPETIYDNESHTGIKKYDLLSRVQKHHISQKAQKRNTLFNRSPMSGLWKKFYDTKKQARKILFKTMQRKNKRNKPNNSQIRQNGIEISQKWNERRKEPCMERWSNLFQKAWKLQTSKICQMSKRIFEYVTKRRLCYGTSSNNGSVNEEMFNKAGSSPSYQSQSSRQQIGKLNVISDKQSTQNIRGTRAKITPIKYKGNVWCVETSTGAFVARRKGKIFITGNSGFPKSLDVGKAVDKELGNDRDIIDKKDVGPELSHSSYNSGKLDRKVMDVTKGETPYEGFGTALKPAMELWTLCRKPLSEKNVAKNVLKWGTGGINIDGCRVGTAVVNTHSRGNNGAFPKRTGEVSVEESGRKKDQRNVNKGSRTGRYPSNVIHDGSEEVLELFPYTKSGFMAKDTKRNQGGGYAGGFPQDRIGAHDTLGDSGSAARFFYCAKASGSERNAGLPFGQKNNHPTVKPLALMKYLCRLVTPKGGTICDPFAGSGTTGCGAVSEGFSFIGIEQDPESLDIAEKRIAYYLNLFKESNAQTTLDDLF